MKKFTTAKNYSLIAVVYAAVLAIYNIFVFLAFDNFNGIFWLSYGFMTASVLLNVAVVVYTSLSKKLDAVFLGIPLLYYSLAYVCAELFTSTVFIIFREYASIKLAVAFQLILLLVFVICAAFALLTRNTVGAVNDEIKEKTTAIKLLAVDVRMLENSCEDSELRAKLHKTAEAIQFSDPMSNEYIAPLDDMIKSKVTELKYLCSNNSKAEAMEACTRLQMYLKERAEKLLLTK